MTKAARRLSSEQPSEVRKDRILDELAIHANVAQFVSFSPSPNGRVTQEFTRLRGFAKNHKFSSTREALFALLNLSADKTLNVRSYSPDSPRSKEFVYGIASLDEACAVLERLAGQGLYLIANETVDIHDGGVSGVIEGNLIEFAPDDTPRCVEKPGVASLPRALGMRLLAKTYGLDFSDLEKFGGRLEFSVHPKPRGWKQTHVLVWEHDALSQSSPEPKWQWPNKFSRHLGDKAFGLLLSNELGVPVPRTTVFSRRVKPFLFGTATGSHEVWTRTCPREPEPGRYTTAKGWLDPFKLLQAEDPNHENISSVLCQDAVPAKYSGAAIVLKTGELAVEGRSGEGDAFMLGRVLPDDLPDEITAAVRAAYTQLAKNLGGGVRFEWVHDGSRVWIVQLHFGATESTSTVIVPGEAEAWTNFRAEEGIEALRALLPRLSSKHGINVIGEFGLTSHLADLLRKANRPARLAKAS
jgi:hypothetical protein